jgi:polyisoprenoid-binding protein YceI
VFGIVPAESQARFTLGELLGGNPKTVVGVTDQVAGEITVDPGQPQAALVSVVQVRAGTLTTDSDLRNQAIRRFILQTDRYEFITFTPKTLAGLPDSVTVGQPFSFQIIGDLTIRDVTNEATFDVTVNPTSETRLEGLASTAVMRADYGLEIPSVPGVADVDEEVLVELEFVAISGD